MPVLTAGAGASMRGRRAAGWRAAQRAVAVLTAALVALLTALAAPAAAHPALVSSDPADGYALATSPKELLLRFSQPVQPAARPLQLVRDGEASIPLLVDQEDGGAVLRGVLDGPLERGRYVVRYDVVARDGDVLRGEIRFTVGLPAGPAAARAAAPGVAPDLALPRVMLFLGLALALGGLVAAWDAARVTGRRPAIRPLRRVGAALAAAGAAGQLLVIGGTPDRIVDLVRSGGPARLLLAELMLLLAAFLVPRIRPMAAWPAAALVGVVLLEGVRAHPGKVGGGPGVALTVVHLLAASVWVGGLVHVLRLAVRWRGTTEPIQVVVASYARTALVLVAVIAATGTANALLLLPAWRDVVETSYGQLLIGKLGVFLAVVAAAAAARSLLRRRSGRALGRAAVLEAGLLVIVVIASGALTTATPARLVPAGAALAAPSGPVLRMAERARQVTVAVVVSDGRLDLRADVPDDGRPVRYRISATVTGADGATAHPTLRGCGTACWTAEARWARGLSVLALDVTADPWLGGRVTLPVSWPPAPAPELLDRVRAVMATQPAVVTFETVTSGFGVDVPTRSTRTGREYLSSQPWSSGGATDVVLVLDRARRTLFFALPAPGYHFRLELDAQDRVVAERIVTPNHLLIRKYRYPSSD